LRSGTVTVLAIAVGVFLLLSLGFSYIQALPAPLLAIFLLSDRAPQSRARRLLLITFIELALAWFLVPGLVSREGVAPENYLLADEMAALLMVLPPITYLLVRNRTYGLTVIGSLTLLLVLGTVGVPFIPLGGACTGQAGNCHVVNTYGSASWLFICAGAEYATPPGGVSTGLPSALDLHTPLGDYFFAACVFL